MNGEPQAPPAPDVAERWRDVDAGARPPLIVREPLRRLLDAAGLGAGEALEAEPIGDGHSNVTYLLRRGPLRLVLRRPPRPPFPAGAHDVVREAGLLQRLTAAGVRAPRVLTVCDDADVIGAPFYVMEHIDGLVVAERVPEAYALPAARRRLAFELVDALVELHAVDATAPALAEIGRPDGYLARQLRRFGAILAAQRTRPLPELDAVADWLAKRLPASADMTLVHGDFRLGNAIYSADEQPRLLALLDWEMATRGDPLADVGYLCATWAQPGDRDNPMLDLSAATRAPGFPDRDELRERYARGSGRDLDGLGWYEVLALWKSAIFLESSYRRYRDGTTDDDYFARLGDGVPALAQAALERTRALG